ncbi:hypothetical protein FHR34_001503 [Kitasatospora kifunensis]|uniref:Uncharacterized protein n=1 Tax=Kitasatospora kifunensis TaxID=58351 RepID=A0A7W7QZ74_KITKI|nr:hypothetical protein [Kitasatospora kifunensis]
MTLAPPSNTALQQSRPVPRPWADDNGWLIDPAG